MMIWIKDMLLKQEKKIHEHYLIYGTILLIINMYLAFLVGVQL